MSNIQKNKIKKIDELVPLLDGLKGQRRKIILCHGVFDLLHPGHIRHFGAAKEHGDILVVTVTPDPYVNKGPGRPVFPQELRAEVLSSLAVIDYVAINEWPTAVETIEKLKPHIYVKGSDYKDIDKDITGGISREREAVKKVGGKIVYTEDITFSSSSLANNFLNLYSEETAAYLKNLRNRTTEDEITKNINKVLQCRTLIIGDTIIDEYHYCSPMGKSPKENVIVSCYSSEEVFAGGVLAAANHVASLCEKVDLVTCLGREESKEDFVLSHLKGNITPTIFRRDDAPTIVKRRFVEPNFMRKLFEICFLKNQLLPEKTENEIYNHLDRILPDYDLVLVTDFGHGMMTPRLIDLVCKKARFLAVNAQTNSSNMGFNLVTKYPRADYICIDEPEARLALHDQTSELDAIAGRLSSQLDAHFVTVTGGHHGCLVYSKQEGGFRIPAFTRTVVDTVGAGDAFLSISSPCVAMGVPIEQAGFTGNAAGALKVGIVGHRSSIEKASLLKYITTLLK